jgi:hypothetical protein
MTLISSVNSLRSLKPPVPEITFYFGEDPNGSGQAATNIKTSELNTCLFAESKIFSIQLVSINFNFPIHPNGNTNFTLKFANRINHFLVEYSFSSSGVDAQKLADISACLQATFTKLEISPLIDGKVEELLTDLQHVRDSISAKTESAIGELTASIANSHRESSERIDELIKKREAYFEDLAQKHRDRVAAEEARINDLEKALTEKEIALNLKEPIGERRRIHTELRERLQEQISTFKPSRAVNRSRLFVRTANFVLIGLSIGAFIYFALSATGLDPSNPLAPLNVLLYLKLLLSAGAAFGFSAAYIKWEGRVADHLSEIEFRMRDKAVDIERSAWLVETVEALSRPESNLPDGLLPLLGNNLFESSDSKDSEAEEFSHFLQHLVGKKGSFEARLPTGGSVKIESDGKRPKDHRLS